MTTESIILQLHPSYISKIWKINLVDNLLKIPSGKLRRPVTRIVDKIIIPVLSAGIDIESVYPEKITPFQEYWLELVQSHKTHNWKQKPSVNLTFYDRTIKMVKSDPIFANDMGLIIDTVEILRDYEMNIQSMIVKRLALLEEALNNIDKKDLLTSLYGSYMALLCFWYIAGKERQNPKVIPAIAKISHTFAINVDSYAETLDIITNPKEMDMMKRAEQWERERQQRPIQKHNLQNRSK